MLDLCKRCGKEVCDYVNYCFDFEKTFASDSVIACNTKLEHVFFDGDQWHCSPLRHGEEVGWHSLLFESLCHAVLADLREYERFAIPNAKSCQSQRFWSSCPSAGRQYLYAY